MSHDDHTSDLTAVESMLRAARGGDRTGSVRAITLNLIVHAPDTERIEVAIEALEHVGPSHPLRAIVATPGDGDLRASVASSCWVGASDRQVCSERVLVEAHAKALPSAVTSLLVPDLPVFLWWQGPFTHEEGLAGGLSALASRLIVDSGECGLEGVLAARLLAPSVADLVWSGLHPWRDAVAGLFDGPSEVRALQRIRAVDVRGPENEARLMAGWLRSALAADIDLNREGRQHHLERVTMRAGGKEYLVERKTRGRLGTATVPGLLDYPVVLAPPPRPSLLADELSRLAGDRLFERALDAA
ncbi:MAG TPA: glucose-6-phosphate dehydrogenase assembly protein OpcA [Gaiellales bacterium]|nr:glucose-6-phosphate dehydrogenase assembly protein OpcA [Gaiellales bacterium]